jgi:large subunit ribosomal protein L32
MPGFTAAVLLPGPLTVRRPSARWNQEVKIAVPKRKKSRSRTRHRRAQWKAVSPALVPLFIGGREYLVPGRMVPAYRRGLIDPRHRRERMPPAVPDRRDRHL